MSIQQLPFTEIVLYAYDRPLPEAQALVDNPHEFLREITRVPADQQTHPILEQMLQTIQDDTVKEATGSASSAGDVKELMTTSSNGYASCKVKNHHGVPLAGSYHLVISLSYLGGVCHGVFQG